MRVENSTIAACRSIRARVHVARHLRLSPILVVCTAIALATIAGTTPAAAQTYTIEVQASGGGTVTPTGLVDVPAGGSQVFTFVPSNCNRVTDVTIDDVSVGSVSTYTFTNVRSDHLMYVSFGPVFYTITSTAGPGGLIVPTGPVTASCGTSVHFDIQPACTQRITSLMIDGAPVAVSRSYTFSNVHAGHTIDVTFGPNVTSATLTVRPAAGVCSTPDTIVAVVDGADQGPVGFFDGDEAIGGSLVYNGVATQILDPPLGIGPHTLTAHYVGSDCSPPAVSPGVSYDVAPSTNTIVGVGLTASPNPAIPGALVTLVATVTAPGVPVGLITGVARFYDGTALFAVRVVASASARFQTTGLLPGAHNLTVQYSGNGCLAGATSTNVTLNISGSSGTTLQVSGSPNPSQTGAPVAMTASVYVGAILATNATGSVQFREGTTVLGSAPVSGGHATLNYAALTAGSHLITAFYSGDVTFTPASATFAQTVCPTTTQVSLGVSPNPAFSNQPVTLAATLLAGGVPASGQPIDFYDGAIRVGGANTAGGVAQLTQLFSVGQHPLSARYAGNGCLLASTSPTVTLVVNGLGPTLQAASTPDPSQAGQSVAMRASVFVGGVLRTTATGSVQFLEGTTVLGSAPLSGGIATLSYSGLGGGNHTITENYPGDANLGPASTTFIQTVIPCPSSTQVTLVASPNPADVTQYVTLTATLRASGFNVTWVGDPISFFDGATQIGTGTLNQGTASIALLLGAGQHSLTARYAGNGCLVASTSPVVTLLVTPHGSALQVSGAPNPAYEGNAVTVTASVLSDGLPTTATGTMLFFENTTQLGSSTVSGGRAQISLSNLALGDHVIEARYSGDTNFGPGTSTYTQTIRDYGAPLLRVLYPNGGQRFVVGDTITIRWDPYPAAFVPRISLYVSRHLNPPDWETIAEDTPNTGAYAWTVTGPGTNNGPTEVFSALISTADLSGRVGSDASNGPFSIFDPASAALAKFAAAMQGLPTEFALAAPRPNPSMGSMSFSFAVPRLARVRLSVLDPQGRQLVMLVEGEFQPGRHSVSWNGQSARGPVAPGIYLACFDTPNGRFVSRVAILR